MSVMAYCEFCFLVVAGRARNCDQLVQALHHAGHLRPGKFSGQASAQIAEGVQGAAAL